MTLLVEVMERPLDPGYAAAAERRTAAGLPASTGLHGPGVLIMVMVLAFVMTVAVLALRPKSTVVSRAKDSVIAQIQTRQSAAETKSGRLTALRSDVDRLQREALTDAGSGRVADLLKKLRVLTGDVAVAGPGVTVTVDDAASSEPDDQAARAGSDFAEGRVTARDVQVLTNGLWSAGAEAISVNGQRLTARSAIRFAGHAIVVDFRPLTRPYRISAIGDPHQLTTGFANGLAGVYLQTLVDRYHVRSEFAPSDRITVPAAVALDVSVAHAPGQAPAVTPGGSTGATRSTPSTTTDRREGSQ